MFIQLQCVRKQLEIMILFMHHGHTRFNMKLLSSRAQFTLLLLYSIFLVAFICVTISFK